MNTGSLHAEQRQRAHQLLRARRINTALFANAHSVTWLTGFAPPVQLGPNPFAGGPPLLWYENGHFTLLILDGLISAAGALAEAPDCEIITYPGYTIAQPIDGPAGLAAALRKVSGRSHSTAQIGVEIQSLPMAPKSVLAETGWTEAMVIDGWLTELRMIKTAEELTKLRTNFALTDIGHAAARRAVRPGQREIDVWTEIHGEIERAAGHRVPLGNDCVVNTRQANIGGWPEANTLGAQDSIIIDLSTLDQGYWSDSCATYYASEPTPEQRTVHQVVADALDFATNLVRPGVKANTIDRKTRDFIADTGFPVYPHHTGHGVGVSGHEEPRIVPYNEQILEEGMVIMLEPGIYLPGKIGVRLEDALLVTADGAKILTKHDKRLP